jgi:hypothetical protein
MRIAMDGNVQHWNRLNESSVDVPSFLTKSSPLMAPKEFEARFQEFKILKKPKSKPV